MGVDCVGCWRGGVRIGSEVVVEWVEDFLLGLRWGVEVEGCVDSRRIMAATVDI